jgi:DNA-binding XRE family transcriptional regulator
VLLFDLALDKGPRHSFHQANADIDDFFGIWTFQPQASLIAERFTNDQIRAIPGVIDSIFGILRYQSQKFVEEHSYPDFGEINCGMMFPVRRYANNAYVNTVDPNTCKSQHSLKVQEFLLALGQRVRELRLKKRWSQEAFADIVGVHRTWMGAVERGESNLSFTNLVLISRALGVTLSQLLSGLEKTADTLKAPPKNPAKS